MSKLFNWIHESNREKHFLYAIPVAVVGTLLMVIGMAVGMEYKDKLNGGKFDWLDILATILGGVVGQALQVVIIMVIKNLFF